METPPQPIRPVRIEYEESPRLRRIRRLVQLLDRSIVLPNGYRIGLDPIIGLIPVVGDFAGAAFSFYIICEATLMGIPKRILFRMCGNVLLETFVGEIPVLGDFFDAVWQANVRNLRLIELHHRPGQPERRPAKIFWTLALFFFAFTTFAIGALVGTLFLLAKLFYNGN